MSRRVLSLLAGAAVVAASAVVPSSAQPRPDIDVDVRAERPWFGTGGPLSLDVRVANRSNQALDDLRLSVALHERVRSRSALREALGGDLAVTPLEAFTLPLDELRPGTARTLSVRQPPEALAGFAGAPAGLYPLTVTVRRSTGPALDQVVTAVAFLTESPVQPLSVLPVLRIHPTALVGPDGVEADAVSRLQRLATSIAALPAELPARLLAISPVFLDELALLSEGRFTAAADAGAARRTATQLMATLRELVAGADVALAPHANVEIPHADTGLPAQLVRGSATLRDRLGAETGPTLYPPGLVVDADSLAIARDAGARHAVVAGDALGSSSLTPTDLVRSDGLLLVPSDRDISGAVDSAASDLDVSRAIASTAMTYFESPGRRRTMALVVDLMQVRAPAFLTSVARSPWMRPVTAGALGDLRIVERELQPRRTSTPPASYRRARADARRAVDAFDSFTLDRNALADQLRTALDRTRSTSDWAGRWPHAEAWARRIVAAVRGARALITAAGGGVTFTSSSGEVPVTVSNHAGFPVRVRVGLRSVKLRFPSGAERLVDRVDPPGETITFRALADATGTFPLTVTVRSPDGSVVLDQSEVIVRSTAVNRLALVLTLAAAAFVIVSYGRRVRRRRPQTP